MNILVINCGSSSLKFSLVETESGESIAQGLFENLGSETPRYKMHFKREGNSIEDTLDTGEAHEKALGILSDFLASSGLKNEIHAIGHRVVHGGERFTEANLINSQTIEAIEACSPLAPLHNPANLLGIRTSQQRFSDLPQVAVFDTAFHQSLEPQAFLYALPYSLYRDHGIRRYGFHGSSHKFVAQEAARLLDRPHDSTCFITAHLGNGCSAAAIENGSCVDTSMGLTPLEGLVMGTRSGDLDPGILLHLNRSLGFSIEEIDTLLNKKSGLLGVSELSNDMRTLRQAALSGNQLAKLAIDLFTRRLAKCISALRSTLSSLDAIVFTGGIGENDWRARAETLARLSHLGVVLDEAANKTAGREQNGIISSKSSSIKAMVVETNEELMIARETKQVVG